MASHLYADAKRYAFTLFSVFQSDFSPGLEISSRILCGNAGEWPLLISPASTRGSRWCSKLGCSVGYFVWCLCALDNFLLAETKYWHLQVKSGKVNFSSQFVMVSCHRWFAQRQSSMAEEKRSMARWAGSNKWQKQSPFCPLYAIQATCF